MDALINAAHKVAGLDRQQVSYVPGYPEENVYKLINTLLEFDQAKDISELSVVFISNSSKKIQMWCQKGAKVEDSSTGYTAREYHVILVQRPPPSPDMDLDSGESVPAYVWDLDTDLPLPCRLAYYAHNALRTAAHAQFDERYTRFYRAVSAAAYQKHFASDRMHMRLADGGWRLPPPTWPCIINKERDTSTIAKYWDLFSPPKRWQHQDQDSPWGVVMDEVDMLNYFKNVV